MVNEKSRKSKCVFVGISGGVDSAVAAALLKEGGYDVRGIFLREYDLSLPSAFGDAIQCTQEGDRRSALAVAAALDIPFEEWDFRTSYEQEVVKYMVREYKEGRTPNPDIMCNSVIKFGLFFQRALQEGADFVATGHYAQIKDGKLTIIKNNKKTHLAYRQLMQAHDAQKDQTYFLYTLGQDQLRRCMFPVGGYEKSEVRVLAKKYNLPNWNRKDSQGICFIGKLSMKDFLTSAIKPKSGKLIAQDGSVVGEHDGAWYYTIGQRHGLGFGGGDEPYYVVGKDVKKNIVYVDHQLPASVLYQKDLVCGDMHWISGSQPGLPFRCLARIRYRQPLQACTVSHMNVRAKNLEFRVVFDAPQRAITPGQSVVFYNEKECLGGGVIL
ncbi:MAG: tRNA 2-thiouridine(34) synthase MnmA [Candidatus Uhrbacteria bacterium]|nr:tRNA 2-thiouridine(34) synthase MnmA [Candidatus Uhrbacteria bacterium]